MMIIPLFENGEPLNWSIQLREDPEGFTIEELEESVLRNLGGATVRNVIITRQLREANQRIQREIDQIAKIQRTCCRRPCPRFPVWRSPRVTKPSTRRAATCTTCTRCTPGCPAPASGRRFSRC